MNPELNDSQDKDLSKQLPPNPTTEARTEDTYTEPEIAIEPLAVVDSAPVTNPQSAQTSTQPSPMQSDSGKTLAIIGLVLAFFPLQLIGLVLSIIAKVKAAKGSSVNTLAIVGIVLNTLFGLISLGIMAAFVLAVYSGVTERVEDTRDQAVTHEETQNSQQDESLAVSAVISAQKIAEAHNALEGFYPKTVVQLQSITPIEIVSTKALTAKPQNPSIVEYAICDNGESFRIGYWSNIDDRVVYDTEDQETSPTDAQDCTVVAQILNTKAAEEGKESNRGYYPL